MSLPLETSRERARNRSRAWQARRAALLQQACQFIVTELAKGISVTTAFRTASRKFRNRSLGDDGKQLSLSRKSVERIWYKWIATKNDTAFALRYVGRSLAEIDPLLLRLIVCSCVQQSRTVSQVLTEHAERASSFAKVSTLYRALPARAINRFVRAERTLIRRRDTAAKALLKIDSELRALRAEAESSLLAGGLAK